MPKLAPIRVTARNEVDAQIFHSAEYPCSVDSEGIFRAEIEAGIYSALQSVCERRRDLACKMETFQGRGRSGLKYVVAGAALRNVEAVLYEYGKAMVEADVRRELRIFYTLRLAAHYYRTAEGEILPNAKGVSDYGKDGGKWHGQPASVGQREDGGFLVGVGARIVQVTTVIPKGGASSTSYDNPEDDQLGDWGRKLGEFVQQAFPSASRGEPSRMRSVPYDEAAAKMFVDVLFGIARIADMLERNLDDASALPALIAGGGMRLLGGGRDDR